MEKPQARSLRKALTAAVLGLAGLGVIVSAALVVLTTYLHRTSVILGKAIESVRLTQQAEVVLLLHARAEDGVIQRDLEAQMRQALLRAQEHVTTEREARLLADAESQVESYLASFDEPGIVPEDLASRRASAYASLSTLAGENIAQATEATRDAERWDVMATRGGVATAILPLLLAGWLLWWLNTRAFQPFFRLAHAMGEFGRGDRAARAEETGPLEVREMAAEFNDMAAALAAQRETQMAFLAGVAHDLRNPLSALSMAIAGFHPDRPLPPEPRIRRAIEVVQRQIRHMDRMLGDFLDVAKIEAGQLDLAPETVDARSLVLEAVDLFRAASPKNEISHAVPDAPVTMRCDPHRMAQVLTNLVSNALKYSPGGGPVAVTLARDGGDAVLEVKDGGIGMSQDEQRLLFEPFRRIGPNRDKVSGLGLGLFVVKRVVEAHGGSIAVESAPGLGSAFRVRLPLVPDEAP